MPRYQVATALDERFSSVSRFWAIQLRDQKDEKS